jgi:hypothetical protein
MFYKLLFKQKRDDSGADLLGWKIEATPSSSIASAAKTSPITSPDKLNPVPEARR